MANVSHRSINGKLAVEVVDGRFSAERIVGIIAIYGNVPIAISVIIEPGNNAFGVDVAQIGRGFHLDVGCNSAELRRGKNISEREMRCMQFGVNSLSTQQEVYIGIAMGKHERTLGVVIVSRSPYFPPETDVAQTRNLGRKF